MILCIEGAFSPFKKYNVVYILCRDSATALENISVKMKKSVISYKTVRILYVFADTFDAGHKNLISVTQGP